MPQRNKSIENKFNLSKLYNKWVATPSFKDKRIVGYGDTPEEALFSARDKGYNDPVASYFLNPNEPFYFNAVN